MGKERKEWLDIAKGITIILMVLGHSSLPAYLNRFIFAFHMPLFFIASGWTSNWERYTVVDFIKRRTKTLLVPFIVYSVIVLLFHVCYNWMTVEEWLLKGWGDGYALWFVPVLFLASVIARLIYSLKQYLNNDLWYAIIICVLLIGIDLCFNGCLLPWSLSTVPYATFLVILGSEWSRKSNKRNKNNNIRVFVLSIIVVATVSYFWKLDLCFNRILPSFPLLVGAISGTYMVFQLSKYLESANSLLFRQTAKILMMVGKETYIVVAFSLLIIMLINYYFNINPIVKYILLFGALVVLSIIKNFIKNLLSKSKSVIVNQ